MGKETPINGAGIEQQAAKISITLVEPDLARVSVLQATINTIGEALRLNGVVVQEIPQVQPPKQFLASQLTLDQRKQVDDLLTEQYAQESVATQAELTKVPIVESYEPMVFLPDLFASEGVNISLSDLPFHQACGEWAGKERQFWLRADAAGKLVNLGKALESAGLMIHIEDAFRPVGVQEGLFRRRVDWTQQAHPDWSWDQVLTEAKSKTAVVPRLASHKAGSAVDITLRKLDGTPLDLGNKYPEGGALVALDCPFVTQEQWETRQIFASAARMAGFAVYPGEDWHISLGDNLASLNVPKAERSQYQTKYGPIKDFDRSSGQITDIYQPAEYDVVFSAR